MYLNAVRAVSTEIKIPIQFNFLLLLFEKAYHVLLKGIVFHIAGT